MSAVIQQAIECVLSLFLIGLVGYVLARRGWFSPETKALLPRLVTMITLPPYLFANILSTFNRDQLVHLIYGSLVPITSVVIVFLLALPLAKLLKIPENRWGAFCVGVPTSNTIFIGLPVNVALFGPDALPYVLLYFFGNTTFFWSVGNYCLSLGGEGGRRPEKILSLATFRRIFSPPLMGFLCGLALVLLSWRPPNFIMTACAYIGGLTTPLAIIFIGIALASVKLKELKPDRDVLALLIGRFTLSPIVIYGLISLFPLPPLMAKVFIIQSSLPMVSSIALLSGYYGTDVRYASVVASLSTLAMLVTVPAYMLILAALPLE
ncbi:MAG: AEC family transporter [Candidatus Adiutrix sp.]|jgi:predicted permease|nr:AEC family transporter [Candidatus Adiutrix sp.]